MTAPLAAATDTSYKILVVMSYEPTFGWSHEIKTGIESVLGKNNSVTYFYMNTKKNIQQGVEKAAQAYALYQKLQPDGVIAADDNAQSTFVVPYLKNKVPTPVMFCGVNAEPSKYGYPASNVSGILERHHISQSLAFATQLIPSIKTFGYIAYESPSGLAVAECLRSKTDTFPVHFLTSRFPKTLAEVKAMGKELKQQCDIVFCSTLNGVKDDKGRPLSDKEAIPVLAEAFGKPVIGGDTYSIGKGLLGGVMKTGQEQGETAAKMLLKAMAGTPISQIPVTTNHIGKPMLNVTVMERLGITPKPIFLKGTTLVEMAPAP